MKTAASKSSSRSGKNANAPQPKRRQEGHDKKNLGRLSKGIDQLAKGGCANQSATKAKKTAAANVMAQQILGLTTGDARIKTMGPAKCS